MLIDFCPAMQIWNLAVKLCAFRAERCDGRPVFELLARAHLSNLGPLLF